MRENQSRAARMYTHTSRTARWSVEPLLKSRTNKTDQFRIGPDCQASAPPKRFRGWPASKGASAKPTQAGSILVRTPDAGAMGGEGRGGIGNGWNRFARNPPLAAVQELKSRCASGRPTFQAPRRASGLFFRRIARLERGRTPRSSGSLQPASFLCRRRALLAPGRRYSTTSSLASARVGISA